MQALPTEYYTSPAIFERERARIFGRLWLFAGLKMMVQRSASYYARDLAGVPIVLQNVGGEVGCFLNSCVHRNAQIQPEGLGVRGFVCGYHGFRYASDGSVVQIPFEQERFRYTPEERACLRLKRFALRAVGEFLFVNFADDPIPLEAQFSEGVLRDLGAISDYLDHDLICAQSTHRYNWKLPGENLRDYLHPTFVHPQTLAPYYDFTPDSDEPRALEGARVSLRDVSFGGPEGRAKKESPPWPYWSALERWPDAKDSYYNYLLFPNVHIVSPDGCRMFGIEQYDPVSADQTRLLHFMLTAKRKQPIPYGDALLRGALRGARGVLDEDARIMERTQAGMLASSPTMQLGHYEGELHRFVTVARELVDA